MKILLVISGIISGIISGMGMGGGTALIPILTIFFNFKQQSAQGINLLSFLPSAIFSLIVHIRNKLVNFKVAIPIIISGIISSVFASFLANIIDAKKLKIVFGIFLLLIGIYQTIISIKTFIDNKKSKKINDKRYRIVIGYSNIFK